MIICRYHFRVRFRPPCYIGGTYPLTVHKVILDIRPFSLTIKIMYSYLCNIQIKTRKVSYVAYVSIVLCVVRNKITIQSSKNFNKVSKLIIYLPMTSFYSTRYLRAATCDKFIKFVYCDVIM